MGVIIRCILEIPLLLPHQSEDSILYRHGPTVTDVHTCQQLAVAQRMLACLPRCTKMGQSVHSINCATSAEMVTQVSGDHDSTRQRWMCFEKKAN